jgi:hypothetical protein
MMARFRSRTRRAQLAACALVIVACVACGGEKTPTRLLPTITPTPATPVAGAGPFLAPLTGGHSYVAADSHYSISVPSDWTRINAPPAEQTFVQPGSTELANGVTVNLVRERLGPTGITTAQAYAESARQRIGDIYQDVAPISFDPVRIGTHGAWRWTYTAKAGGVNHYFYQLFVIDGAEGFVLTGVAPVDADQRATQALFDSIAGSLTFVRG